jgi:hypothetical protein
VEGGLGNIFKFSGSKKRTDNQHHTGNSSDEFMRFFGPEDMIKSRPLDPAKINERINAQTSLGNKSDKRITENETGNVNWKRNKEPEKMYEGKPLGGTPSYNSDNF